MKKKTTNASKHPLYATWHSMRQRCNTPTGDNYHWYGGRGIKVCDRWNIADGRSTGFFNFIEDMGDKPSSIHTLERQDNDGDYCPENCCWATPAEQTLTKRCSGGSRPGERNPSAKLSDFDAIDIRWLSGWGVKGAAIARAYGISKSQVSKVILGRSFAHNF